MEPETETTYDDQDPSNVRQIGGRGEPEFTPEFIPDWPEGVSLAEAGDKMGEAIRDGGAKMSDGALPQRASTSLPSKRTGSDRRRALLDEAADLAYKALEVMGEAVDVAAVTDIKTRDKYAGVLREIASAAEDFENKI